MITNGINFKNFLINKKSKQITIILNQILDKKNQVIQSLSSNYKDSFNRSHVHANSFFSGAYYVKVPKNSGQIKFNDPRSGPKYIFPNRKKEPLPEHLWTEVYVQPVENRVIMFPAWLEHLVDLNESNDTRISVSFNFTQHGLF